jgi:hypothetical protein
MNAVPKLHDATLESFTLQWEEGVAHVRLSTGMNGTGVVTLEASGVLRALCPRVFPWGPSDSVNEVKLEMDDFFLLKCKVAMFWKSAVGR